MSQWHMLLLQYLHRLVMKKKKKRKKIWDSGPLPPSKTQTACGQIRPVPYAENRRAAQCIVFLLLLLLLLLLSFFLS